MATFVRVVELAQIALLAAPSLYAAEPVAKHACHGGPRLEQFGYTRLRQQAPEKADAYLQQWAPQASLLTPADHPAFKASNSRGFPQPAFSANQPGMQCCESQGACMVGRGRPCTPREVGGFMFFFCADRYWALHRTLEEEVAQLAYRLSGEDKTERQDGGDAALIDITIERHVKPFGAIMARWGPEARSGDNPAFFTSDDQMRKNGLSMILASLHVSMDSRLTEMFRARLKLSDPGKGSVVERKAAVEAAKALQMKDPVLVARCRHLSPKDKTAAACIDRIVGGAAPAVADSSSAPSVSGAGLPVPGGAAPPAARGVKDDASCNEYLTCAESYKERPRAILGKCCGKENARACSQRAADEGVVTAAACP
ncbi:MAG: hypothetical protein HY553_01335 [Elusimicrobia bacterium]|nr:hypothetical protein [Elusimicrobiota bacterium]